MKSFATIFCCLAGMICAAAPVPDEGARKVLAGYAERGKDYAPRSGRTAIFARAQLKYGLDREDFLHRWSDRPLWQDSAIPRVAGQFIAPGTWQVMWRSAKRYGIDGYAFFPITGGRDQFFARSGMPGYTIAILPEFITGNSLDDACRIVDLALKCPRVYRVNGKMVITTYAGNTSPDYWVKLKKDLTAKYGDLFLFLPMHTLPRNIVSMSKETLTAAEVETLADCIRTWLRHVDGYYYNNPPLNELRYYDEQFDRDVMIPLLHGILSEPEFKDKLLAWGTKSGHENYYEKGSYTYNCGGTSMLRGSVGAAVAAKADVVNLVEWDEENENTHFRPTIANGFATKRIIRYFAQLAHGETLPPLPGDDLSIPDLILSYRRTLVAGEMLALELVNVPDRNSKGVLPVTVALKDLSGKVVRSFTENVDLSKLDEKRFTIPVSELLDSHLLLPEVSVGGKVFSAGFTPIELRANYNGDNKWYKHPVRDLAGCSAELKATRLPDGRVRIDGKLSSDTPLHQVALLDSGAEIWMDNSDPNFQETADRVVVKVLFRAKQKIGLGFFGTIRIRNAKDLKLMAHGYNDPRWIETLADGWKVKGKLPNNFNCRQMIFSIDRASLDSAVVDIAVGVIPKSGKREALFTETVNVKDIVAKNVLAFSGKYLSHLVFHHNDQPVILPPGSGKKDLAFTVFCTPALPQSVFFLEAFDVNRKSFRSRPVTIYEPSGKEATFHAYNMFTKQVEMVKCDAALLTVEKFPISPEYGAVVKNSGGNQLNGLAGGLAPLVNNLRYLGESGYGNIAMRYLMQQDNDLNAAPQIVKDASGKYVWRFAGKQNIAFPIDTLYPYCGFELSVKLTPATVKATRTVATTGGTGFTLSIKRGVPQAQFFRGNFLNRPVVTAVGGMKLEQDKPAEIVVRFDQQTLRVIVNGVPGEPVPCTGFQLYPKSLSIGLSEQGRGFKGDISELSIRPL